MAPRDPMARFKFGLTNPVSNLAKFSSSAAALLLSLRIEFLVSLCFHALIIK